MSSQSSYIHCLVLFTFFLLCFSLGNHYWHIFKSLILSLVVSNLLISRLKKFFISDTVFLLLAFLFDFLNIISPLWRNYFYTYCLYVFIYVLYYMLFIFFISSLNSYFKLRLIILIFGSFFYSDSLDCFFSWLKQRFVLSCFFVYLIFHWILDSMYIRIVETQVNNIYTQKWAHLFYPPLECKVKSI